MASLGTLALGSWPARTVSGSPESTIFPTAPSVATLVRGSPIGEARGVLLESLGRENALRERTGPGRERLIDLWDRLRHQLGNEAVAEVLRGLVRALYWDVEAGLSRFSVEVPCRGRQVTLAVVAKGDLESARRVNFFVPGFGVDARSFEPSLRVAAPAPGEAVASASLIGGGCLIPDSGYDLTPELLTELYANLIRGIAPSISPDGGLTIVGNSMGGMIGLGVTLYLSSSQRNPGRQVWQANYVADNSMTWDILGRFPRPFLGETRTFLHRALSLTRRYLGQPGISLGINTLFRIRPVVDAFVGTLYNRPSGDDLDYHRHLFLNHPIPPEGFLNVFGALVAVGMPIGGWWQYLSETFPDRLTGGRIHLPAGGRVTASDDDHVFATPTAEKLRDRLVRADGLPPWFASERGPHLETDPRALRAATDPPKE